MAGARKRSVTSRRRARLAGAEAHRRELELARHPGHRRADDQQHERQREHGVADHERRPRADQADVGEDLIGADGVDHARDDERPHGEHQERVAPGHAAAGHAEHRQHADDRRHDGHDRGDRAATAGAAGSRVSESTIVSYWWMPQLSGGNAMNSSLENERMKTSTSGPSRNRASATTTTPCRARPTTLVTRTSSAAARVRPPAPSRARSRRPGAGARCCRRRPPRRRTGCRPGRRSGRRGRAAWVTRAAWA